MRFIKADGWVPTAHGCDPKLRECPGIWDGVGFTVQYATVWNNLLLELPPNDA